MAGNDSGEIDFRIEESDLVQSDAFRNNTDFELTNTDLVKAHLENMGGVLEIDNGSYRIELQLSQLREHLIKVLSEETADRIIERLLEHANHVTAERAEGRHAGSSELIASLSNIFYGQDGLANPEEFGLQTKTELKLIIELILSYAKEVDGRE